MEDKIIDLDEVMERVQDDKELLLELFDIFSQDYELKLQKLKPAMADKNFETIKDVIHSIKGAAGNISAKFVHAECIKIEHQALAKNIAGVEQSVAVLNEHYKNLQKTWKEKPGGLRKSLS